MMAQRPARGSILVVEDDPVVVRMLVDVLEDADYRVWHASDGQDARGQLERAAPDLILLDLMLPDVDGLVLCSLLKSVADVPIVICTASARRSDSVLALKLGADDFVRKPFEVEDLLARIEAVLRRAPQRTAGAPPPPPRQTELRVGELVVEPARRRASLGGEPLTLTPTEFRLLTVLSAHPEVVLTRDQLAQEVWGYADASNGRTIDVHVRRLRVKLGHRGIRGPSIVSVRGMGYLITPDDTAISAA
jgi:two-component system OmpR family response regulator